MDSHCRFVDGWDDILEDTLYAVENEVGCNAQSTDANNKLSATSAVAAASAVARGVILTAYPPAYHCKTASQDERCETNAPVRNLFIIVDTFFFFFVSLPSLLKFF